MNHNASVEQSAVEPRSIAELLSQRVEARADEPFLISEADGHRFTFNEFAAAVARTAALLSDHEITKDDVVSLLMPNSAEYIIGYFACWQLGALAGPVNSLLKENEIEFVMNNSEAKAILIGSEFRERVENIQKDLPHLRSIITYDDEAEATDRYARLRRA